MTELITYRGGSCGDFVRTIISNCEYEIDANGKVKSIGIFDFTRIKYLRERIEFGEDVYDIAHKLKRYINRHMSNKRMDYITSHDFPTFIDRFNSGKEFFEYVNILDIKRVLYITITTDKSLRLRTLNSLVKNNGKGYDDYIEHYDKYGIHQLEKYKKDKNFFLDSKRENDIILELECIYDKEYLRNFLLEHYNWSDTNYDAIYDDYMSKQPRIGD